MKTYSPEIEAQLVARKIRRRGAIKFVLPSGSYGFIMGVRGELTIGGVKYVGSGGLISIETPSQGMEAGGDDIFVSLASAKRINGTLTQLFEPHLLDSIENEVWFNQPAIVYRVWFDANRQVHDLEQVYVRQIFSIVHETVRGVKRIRGKLCTPESFARLAEAKLDGPELQKQIDPTDRGYDNLVTATSDPVLWGGKDKTTATTGGGGGHAQGLGH